MSIAKGIGQQLKQGLYREYLNKTENMAVMPNEIIIKKVTDFISASILFIYFSTKGCDNIGCRNTIRSTRYKRLS